MVGAGPGGIAMVRELQKAGIDTILLESGGFEIEQETEQLYKRATVVRLILAAPIAVLVWLLRAAGRLLGFASDACQGLACVFEYVKGRFLLFRVRPDDICVAA